MSLLTGLLLLLAPWIALASGLAIMLCSVRQLSRTAGSGAAGRQSAVSATSGLLLGAACLGLGVTYLLTSARTGYDQVYLVWLLLAAAAGVVSLFRG